MKNKGLLKFPIVVVLILSVLISARNVIIRIGLEQYFRVITGLRSRQPPTLSIDDFILKVGEIIYKNYTHDGLKLEQKVYSLNLDEHYRGIQGANDMESRIVESVMDKASLASSIQGDLNRFSEDISGTILNGLQISDNSIKGLLNLILF